MSPLSLSLFSVRLSGHHSTSTLAHSRSYSPSPRNDSEYAYSAVDKSPLSNYVMRHCQSPFPIRFPLLSSSSLELNQLSPPLIGWVWTASLMPPHIAPNAITLMGFAAIILNFATVWIFCGDLVGPGGWFVYASSVSSLFVHEYATS